MYSTRCIFLLVASLFHYPVCSKSSSPTTTISIDRTSTVYLNAPTTASASLLSPSTLPYANVSRGSSDCCFLIQDTVNANYWATYSTYTWYGIRKVTSVVTSITKYIDTAVTHYETTTTYKNATYFSTLQIGVDNINAQNLANGPNTMTKMLNGTATTTYGTVATSPAGFYVIPSVRIIHVPAVTQANGQLACATTSSWSLLCNPYAASVSRPTTRAAAVFSEMNDQVERYFSGQQWPSLVSYDPSAFWTTSRPATNTSAYPSTTVISFSTPFLFFPHRATTEAVEHPFIQVYPVMDPNAMSTSPSSLDPPLQTKFPSPTPTSSTTSSSTSLETDKVAYGYLPSAIIPWMLKHQDYVERYPNLASCLPGGPSIEYNTGCIGIAPATAGPVPDLTTGHATTVEGIGCFHPGKCPAAATNAVGAAPAMAVDTGVHFKPSTPPKEPVPVEAHDAPANPESNEAPALAPGPSGGGKSPQPNPVSRSSVTRSKSSASPTLPVIVVESSTFNLDSSPNSVIKTPTLPKSSVPSLAPSQELSTSINLGAIIMNAFNAPPQPSTASMTEGTPSQASFPPQVITLPNSQLMTANGVSEFIISSQTLLAGSPAITLHGTTYSLAPEASTVVINGDFSPLPSPPIPPQATARPVVLTTGSSQITVSLPIAGSGTTAAAAAAVIVASQTIYPESSAITVDGITYSLLPSASAIVINGNTSPLTLPPIPTQITTSTTPPLVLSMGTGMLTATPITAGSVAALEIASQTLLPGLSAITVQGVTYSLVAGGSAIVINGFTSTLPLLGQATPSYGLVGGGGGSNNGSALPTLSNFTGKASALGFERGGLALMTLFVGVISAVTFFDI